MQKPTLDQNNQRNLEHLQWETEAKRLFHINKPNHFTNYTHCEECAEHDQTLLGCTVDTIGLAELGNPGWDPLCFASVEGIQYYLPALIRITLATITNEFYLGSFLFHLNYQGEQNRTLNSCNAQQKKFITAFLEYLLEQYPIEIEENCATDDCRKTYEIWQLV